MNLCARCGYHRDSSIHTPGHPVNRNNPLAHELVVPTTPRAKRVYEFAGRVLILAVATGVLLNIINMIGGG